MDRFYINPDIRHAETLPSSFYHSEEVFEALKESVFERSWQWLGDSKTLLPLTESVHPIQLLDNFLSEPILLIRDKDNKINCISNVCTHRGNIIVRNAGTTKQLQCNYHGRRFALDGSFISMPEFKEVKDFPRPCDNLHQFSLSNWNEHLFTSINPAFDFSGISKMMDDYIGFLPIDSYKRENSMSKDYLVNCHWALYCDNYLEGFHIPFVHSDLNAVLDYGQYKTEIFNNCNLQIAYAKDSDEIFDLPPEHPEYGKSIAAFYFWIFPNMMFNFYPWGLSINIVKPINTNKTKVSFISYVFDETKMENGAGAQLDKVEREDEYVVEGVNIGLKSRFYQTGRFSPTKEKGVHHFHGLLAKYINNIS